MRIAGDQGLLWLWELGDASAEDRAVRLMVRSGSGLGWTGGPKIERISVPRARLL
jgi:hypothetical protein